MATTTSTSPPERSEILRRLFRGYYETAKLELPDDMELREFAIQPFGSESYVRHLSFTSDQELRSFLIEKVPLQVYFSAGKYQSPSAPDMESKGWMGSDLM
ncbi:MAG: DNA primase, partial [Sulfolobaceae archaeon]|nr:DNA primase [Sulfolobales archaeon]